jgi:hypothetical protein
MDYLFPQDKKDSAEFPWPKKKEPIAQKIFSLTFLEALGYRLLTAERS